MSKTARAGVKSRATIEEQPTTARAPSTFDEEIAELAPFARHGREA